MKYLELIGLLAIIAVFFVTAFSTLHSFVKLIIIAGCLFTSGAILARLTNSSNHHGLVIIKGKYGFGLMKSIAQKHPKAVNALADLGLSIGFGAFYSIYLFRKTPRKLAVHLLILLLLFASLTAQSQASPWIIQLVGFFFGLAGIGLFSIALNAFHIFTIPGTPAGVMPVVPGVTVPWEAIFAIALIAVVHETSHGVLFFIEKLKVKHSGALLLGFLPIGAFVEPDEKQFAKHNLHGRRRILVAGSASNFYTALLLTPFSLIALLAASTMVTGVLIQTVTPGSPAALANLGTNSIVVKVNNETTSSLTQFVQALQTTGANNTALLTLASGGQIPIKLDGDGKLGVQVSNYVPPGDSLAYGLLAFIAEVLKWSVLLSLALAVINLLPLFVTDGHHLIADEFTQFFNGDAAMGRKSANFLAVIVLLLLLLNMIPFVL